MSTKLLSVLRRQHVAVRDALILTAIILLSGIVAYNFSISDDRPDDYRVEFAELLILGAITFLGIFLFGWRRAAEHERQQERLEVALNNMSRGLAMFDSEQRLVVCNRLYADMYGLTLEQVKPGTSAREILEFRVANQCYNPSDVKHLVDRLITNFGKIDKQVHELSDGRVVNVSHHRAPSGSHIITHDDITEQHQAMAKIAHMARHDALTGLPNRALLKEKLDEAIAGAKRGEQFAVHLLDLDHFKCVNDTLGHSAGDQLLQMTTERLRALVRDKDTVARMGGDEFVILQIAIAQPADASSLALRTIDALTQPFAIDGQEVAIGSSVGIALAPADGLDGDQLMRNADLALYRSKGEGRGTFRFFEHGMDAQMQSRRALEQDLRGALARGEFELHYQPVVNLGRDYISGFEALLRWNHPQRGKVPPSEFIPLAEEIGLITPIGEWVLHQGCQTAVSWPEDLTIAINLSAVQFRSPELLHVVKSALSESGLPAERLILEITETALMEDTKATLSVLYQLRELGVRIAMDDFGTGYSSLSYLQSFPFDKIKIDRSFVKDITNGVGSLNIVRAVAALARGLGIETTAEGVETLEQRDIVKLEGCTEMQGCFFSKPMPAHEIEPLLVTTKKAMSGPSVNAA